MEQRMRQAWIVSLFLIALPLIGQQWPGEKLVVETMFLQDGLPMEMHPDEEGAQLIRPCLPGEPIFLYGPGDREIYPLPHNNLVVIEHENHFQSFYQLPQVSSALALKSYLEEGEALGALAGQSMGFALWDMENRSWVNPLLFLPGGTDWGAPVLEGVLLERDGQRWDLTQGTRIPQGEYRLLLLLSDEPPYPLTPYTMEARLLGSLHGMVEYNGISYKNETLCLLDNPLPYSQMGYGQQGLYNLGEIFLNQGNMNLDIRLQDYQGGQLQRSFSLEVGP